MALAPIKILRSNGLLPTTVGGFPVTATQPGAMPLTAADVATVSGVSSGGLSGADSVVAFPIYDNLSQSYRIGYFDFATFDDPNDSYSVTFRTEDYPELREATLTNVVIVYRDLGPVKVTVQAQGARQLSFPATVEFGTARQPDLVGLHNNPLGLVKVDLTLTDNLIAVTLSKNGGDGNLDIVRVKPVFKFPDSQLQ